MTGLQFDEICADNYHYSQFRLNGKGRREIGGVSVR